MLRLFGGALHLWVHRRLLFLYITARGPLPALLGPSLKGIGFLTLSFLRVFPLCLTDLSVYDGEWVRIAENLRSLLERANFG